MSQREQMRIRSSVRVTPWMVAVLLWLTTMILTPISLWVVGEEVFPLVASVGVVMQAGAVMAVLAETWPARRIAAP